MYGTVRYGTVVCNSDTMTNKGIADGWLIGFIIFVILELLLLLLFTVEWAPVLMLLMLPLRGYSFLFFSIFWLLISSVQVQHPSTVE